MTFWSLPPWWWVWWQSTFEKSQLSDSSSCANLSWTSSVLSWRVASIRADAGTEWLFLVPRNVLVLTELRRAQLRNLRSPPPSLRGASQWVGDTVWDTGMPQRRPPSLGSLCRWARWSWTCAAAGRWIGRVGVYPRSRPSRLSGQPKTACSSSLLGTRSFRPRREILWDRTRRDWTIHWGRGAWPIR